MVQVLRDYLLVQADQQNLVVLVRQPVPLVLLVQEILVFLEALFLLVDLRVLVILFVRTVQ